jgi:hypothetical protein
MKDRWKVRSAVESAKRPVSSPPLGWRYLPWRDRPDTALPPRSSRRAYRRRRHGWRPARPPRSRPDAGNDNAAARVSPRAPPARRPAGSGGKLRAHVQAGRRRAWRWQAKPRAAHASRRTHGGSAPELLVSTVLMGLLRQQHTNFGPARGLPCRIECQFERRN